MGLSGSWCGRCIMVFFTLLIIFTVYVFMSADFVRVFDGDESALLDPVDGPITLPNERLPMLSVDRKTIYVVSEEGLPWANNFILRNPSIPITRIVFRKPGVNSSVHVYPVQRDALLATNRKEREAFESTSVLMAIAFALFGISMGIYMLFCQDICCNGRLDGVSLCDLCDCAFDFYPEFDDGNVDELFDTSETDDSSSADSPIKQQKKINKKNAGNTKIIIDELKKKPLLDV